MPLPPSVIFCTPGAYPQQPHLADKVRRAHSRTTYPSLNFLCTLGAHPHLPFMNSGWRGRVRRVHLLKQASAQVSAQAQRISEGNKRQTRGTPTGGLGVRRSHSRKYPRVLGVRGTRQNEHAHWHDKIQWRTPMHWSSVNFSHNSECKTQYSGSYHLLCTLGFWWDLYITTQRESFGFRKTLAK